MVASCLPVTHRVRFKSGTYKYMVGSDESLSTINTATPLRLGGAVNRITARDLSSSARRQYNLAMDSSISPDPSNDRRARFWVRDFAGIILSIQAWIAGSEIVGKSAAGNIGDTAAASSIAMIFVDKEAHVVCIGWNALFFYQSTKRRFQVLEAAQMLSIEVPSIRSNSSSDCGALSPSTSAREKLATTPLFLLSRALASSRE